MKSPDSIRTMPAVPEKLFVTLEELSWSDDRPRELDQIYFAAEEMFRWKGPKAENHAFRYTYQPIMMEGKKLAFAGIHETEKGDTGEQRYRFAIGKGSDTVELTIMIKNIPSKYLSVETSVDRYDPQRRLPRGLGRSLYQCLFPFLQNVANTHQRTVMHHVEKVPSEITNEDWDRIFLDSLQQRGYVRVSNFHFEKLYNPQTQSL